jgi:hypothetical protein
MSDFLKTPATNVVSTIWTAGEQPTARKFNVTFNSYYRALNTVCKILGPLENDNPSFNSLGKIVSSYTYGRMSPSEQETLADDAERAIVDSFNLARIIGPHASLNPTYLPGSIHTKTEQGTGWLLDSSKKVQQLPFPPYTGGNAYTQALDDSWSCGYGVEIWSGGILSSAWKPVGTPSECLTTETDKVWHLAADGTLYSNQAFTDGDFIKYTLRVPNTFGVLGSGYNCIPDLSIFSMSDIVRTTLYDELAHKGALIVSYIESSGSYSKWRVILPKIISTKDSLVNLDGRGFSATNDSDAFEPFGKYVVADAPLGIPTSGKRYTLNPELYPLADVNLTENVLSLYDSGRGKSYSLNLKWERTNNECVLYFYGPLSLKNQFVDDNGTTLLSSSTSSFNSKDFVLFCLGTNISDTLAQTTLNYARHRHNGLDSYKISHRDLLDAENNIQGFADDQDGSNGGLDFINYNRQLAFSGVEDNPHTQYLNRLGYRFGGSQGYYADLDNTKAVDLNAMHGDLIFYPIYKNSAPYLWSTLSAYNAAVSSGENIEEITWDLSNLSDSTDSFANRRGHAFIFGWPSNTAPEKYSYGATKLYYESHNFLASTSYDNTGVEWRLWRHGFVPGNFTGNGTPGKGLNIGWGNLFFGYREDILNGRLTTEEERTESSAFWRTSEFNVVTTGNNNAGKNTNSAIKSNSAYRDGFNVRATKGSSIWLSAGSADNPTYISQFPTVHTGNSLSGLPGTISIESSYIPSSYSLESTQGGAFSLTTLNEFKEQVSSGAGLFTSPGALVTNQGLYNDYTIPWASNISNNYSFAQLWDNQSFATTKMDTWNFRFSPGSLLDIFNFAPDANKKDINPDTGAVATSTLSADTPIDADDNLGKWPFGRPLLRGTYGIDFCSSSQLENLSTDFKTGFKLWDSKNLWGPDKAILSAEENEFIHREFRFWGKNSKTTPVSPTVYSPFDYSHTQGGNINLLYGFGQPYKRFGKDLSTLSGALSGGNQTDVSPWLNARAISLGSSNPANYGSAIRNASYVDAFQGVRHDPLQPYMAEYVYPFRAIIDTGKRISDYIDGIDYETGDITYDTSEDDITKLICQKNIVLRNSMSVSPVDYYGGKLVFANIVESDLPSIDELIRGSEEIFLQNSSSSYNNAFPRCLVDFKVNLEYFIGRRVCDIAGGTISESTSNQSDENSPHSGKYGLSPSSSRDVFSYGRVLIGYNVMVPASGHGVTGAASVSDPYEMDPPFSDSINQQGLNRLNVVMAGRQPQSYMTNAGSSNNNSTLTNRNNPNAIVGYQDFLGTIMANSGMTSYNSKFPLFKELYSLREYVNTDFLYDVNTGTGIINQLFVPVVNIPDFYFSRLTDDVLNRENYNFAVPYRVYVADFDGRPVYRKASVNSLDWKYADGSAAFGIEDTAVIPIYVELRGKIVIKVVTAPVPNAMVD